MKLDVFKEDQWKGKRKGKRKSISVESLKKKKSTSVNRTVQVEAPVEESAWKNGGSRKPLPLCAFVGAQELYTLRIQVHIEGRVS